MRQLIVTTCSVCIQTCHSTVSEHLKLATRSRRISHKARRTLRMWRREISTQTSSRETLISQQRKMVHQKAGFTRKDQMHGNYSGVNTLPQRRNSAAHSRSNSASIRAISPYTTQLLALLRSQSLQGHPPSIRALSRTPKDRTGKQKEYRSHQVQSINTPNTPMPRRRCQPTRLQIQAFRARQSIRYRICWAIRTWRRARQARIRRSLTQTTTRMFKLTRRTSKWALRKSSIWSRP